MKDDRWALMLLWLLIAVAVVALGYSIGILIALLVG